MSETRITLPALAKINLKLRVLGRRADGYHEIATIFQTVALHDTIRITATGSFEIEFSCDDPRLPTDETNLVARAAQALQERFGVGKGARVRLEKRVPTQAGLGGGSSDAAVTLMALAHLWELAITAQDLIDIGAQLGADVPFFFSGGTARGTGIGDNVAALRDAPEKFLLILKPTANISTSDAYQILDERSLTTPNSKSILSSSQRTEVFENADFDALENDFEPVAFELAPEISRAKAALLNAGAQTALLAGSGSAVFGVFESEAAQRRAIQAIELETGWRVFPCKTVGRDEYAKALGDLCRFLA
ncbi:MAG: 4-(cytidine 5'-diphospho)-2-C-methyl-D-erythritol kinase [Pyrinomonadaceae bacterium]